MEAEAKESSEEYLAEAIKLLKDISDIEVHPHTATLARIKAFIEKHG